MKIKEWKGHKSDVVEVTALDHESPDEVLLFLEDQGYEVRPSVDIGMGTLAADGSCSWFVPVAGLKQF